VAEKKYSKADAEARIEEFLDMVLDDADFDLTYDITGGEGLHPDFENPDFVVRFEGEDVEILLQNKAEVLLALEQLTMEALGMAPEEHSRLCFDANDHRVLRVQELRMSAQAAAERVKKTGQPFHFSPMNSRERRILHLAMREETEVRSESVGEGPIRQVVIVPKSMTTMPEAIRPPRPRPEDDAPRDRGDRRGGFGGRGGGRGGDRRGGGGGRDRGRGGPRGGGGGRDRGPRH
jgi:spoIIIJ-associated protein